MDFGEVLTKAWKIVWKFKILWLFGIFASCSSGGGGGGGGGGGSSSAQYSNNLPPGAYQTMNNIEPWMIFLVIAGMILLGIIITIIVMAVSTVGRIGLIKGTQLADEDEDAHLTFSSLFNSVKPFFWRVLGLNLLVGIGFFVIIMFLVMFVLFGSIITFGLAICCFLPLICLLIPAFWVLTTFVEMANVAVIVEDLGIIDGLKRGWEVFKANLGAMVLMGLVLVIGGMFVGFIIAMPMILTMIPLMMGVFAAIFGETGVPAAGGMIVSGLCCLAYLPVLIIISGIVRAYIGSAWTLTYLRLTKGPAVEEPVELLPDDPIEPEPLPEVVEAEEEPEAADDSDHENTTDAPQDVDKTEVTKEDDILPEDF